MLNAINNTQEATVTQVATVKSITAVNQYLKAKKIRNAKLSKRKEILLQNKAEKKAFQSRLEVPTHTTTQGVDQMNINLIKKIKQATSLAEITVISQELSHKSKKVANAIAFAIAALSAPATLLVRRTAVSPAIPKREWLSTIQAQKNAAKRRALKLAAKAEIKTEAEIEAVAKSKAEAVAKSKADSDAAKAKAKAEVPSKGWFCPSALVSLSKALGLTKIRLNKLNLNLLEESITETKTNTTTVGSQSTAEANQLQHKQGEARNMIQNHFSIPDTEMGNTLLTESGFKSTEEVLSWFKPEFSFNFNGLTTHVKVINQTNPGRVNLGERLITLSDKLTQNQLVRALVHELDHINYGDLILARGTDQLKLLKTLEQCKAHSNCPEFLNDQHPGEELWVRYRDYLRGDHTYQEFFTWYESTTTTTTTTEASETSQQKEKKMLKTSTSIKNQKKARAADRIIDSDLTNLTEEIVFLKSKNGIRFISDVCSSWASPINQTKRVLGLKGKMVKVSFRELSFLEMQKVQKALNEAGWFFVSQNMICREEDAKKVFAAAKKVFKNLTGFVNYGKAWFTTPCKPSLNYVVGLINEEAIANVTGNDGSGFLTAGVHFDLMQFRSTGLDEGLFGKGIVTHTKFIIKDNKVVSIDSLNFGEKETGDFQSWLNNSNSCVVAIDGIEYKKALMLCGSNLKGILKDVPNDDSFTEVDTDFFSLMAGDLDLKPGKLTMPNQISFYGKLDSGIINQLVKKSLKAKTSLRKLVLLENLTEEVISLCKTKFDTKYVQMSDLNIAADTETCQDQVIEGSMNFVLEADKFGIGQLRKEVWMVRTPVQDQNALNCIPSYNPTIVHDILYMSEQELIAKHDGLDQEEIAKVKAVFNTDKKKLQFSAMIAPVVKKGIMWLDTRVQEILVGDNDGDMNSYKEKGKDAAIDDLFTKSKAYKAKEIIKKETSKAFVLDAESSDDWCDEKSQQRLITPNGGQLNVGAISNLQVAVRSQLGFDQLPDVVTFAGKTISGIQQPSIDRQKYKYVLPSLQHWYLSRGPVKINLDGKEKSLIIPGVSWVAKGEAEFKDFDEKKQWTTEELSKWFKKAFNNYDDFSEEIITDIKGEGINAYDPEGYNSLGCQAWGQKFILSVKLLSGNSELAKASLDNQIMAVAEMMQRLEDESIDEETMKDCGICEEELNDSFYSLKWLKQIQHQSCPASLVVLRDKLSEHLVLEDLLVGIIEDYKTIYNNGVNNTLLGLDTNDQESIVEFGNLLSKLFISQKDQITQQLENTNRSTQKQQELSTLGSWVAAANDCGLEWLVNILANNKLDTEERKNRLNAFKKALAWMIADQIHCYFDVADKKFLPNVKKEDLIIFLSSIVKLLDAVDEADSNASSVSWTNQLLVNAAITFKKGIKENKTGLKDLVAKFETDSLKCLVEFIRDQHFGGDSNLSELNIINSHHWNKYSFVMNIAKRPAKALELYTSYGWSEKDFKDSLVDLVLKEVGKKDNRKFIVPTKVTYLLDNKWWGDMVKGLAKSQTVNIYYRTLCDGNGDVGYVVEAQTQKAWLTFTNKYADKFEVLAPYGLSEVISTTQLNNLLIDNEPMAVSIEDSDDVASARKTLAKFGEYGDLKHLVAEIIRNSLIIKGYVKNYDDFEQSFVAVPYGYLTANINHKTYSTNFRNAMHLLYGIEKASTELISEMIENKDFDGAFDLMYPVVIRKDLLGDFGIDLAGFKTRDEMSLFDDAKAKSAKISNEKGPRLIKKQKMNQIWADFRDQQQNLSYKKMKQVEINLDEKLAYLGNQSPIDLFNVIANNENYRARLLLLNRDFLLTRNLETMLNISKQLSSGKGDKDQLSQIYENCKNSLLKEIGNPSLKKMVYSAITDPDSNGLNVISKIDSNDLIDLILKD